MLQRMQELLQQIGQSKQQAADAAREIEELREQIKPLLAFKAQIEKNNTQTATP